MARIDRFTAFNAEFERQIKNHPTYQQAYEVTEKMLSEKAGHSYYSSWESFKTFRNRKLRERKG